MLAVVRTAAVILLAAVYDLHLNFVTLFSIRSQLVSRVTHTGVRAQCVVAAVSTVGLCFLTLINIFTCFPVLSQDVTSFTVTVSFPSINPTLVHTASVLFCTGILQFTMLAVLGQPVIWLAATAEMSYRLLHTVVLTSSVADGTRMNGDAGAAVHMHARARVAFTMVRAPGVNTSVLAASIMNLALINILTCFALFIQFLSRRTPAVETSNGVTAESLTAAIGLLAFINIILAAGPVEPCETVTKLRGPLPTVAPVEAHTVATHRIQTTSFSIKLRPSVATLVDSLIILSVHLSVSSVVRCPSLVSHTP